MISCVANAHSLGSLGSRIYIAYRRRSSSSAGSSSPPRLSLSHPERLRHRLRQVLSKPLPQPQVSITMPNQHHEDDEYTPFPQPPSFSLASSIPTSLPSSHWVLPAEPVRSSLPVVDYGKHSFSSKINKIPGYRFLAAFYTTSPVISSAGR
jgi:hypothetical protein